MGKKDWFREAGYGMMVHFGLYSLLGGEYRGRQMGDFLGEWAQPYFRIPNIEYEKLAAAFNPIYFDADEWVQTAKAAGMRYIVFTAKHHDGFAMYRSRIDRFNIVDATPFKRDVTKELAESCKRHNMRMGLYYSQALDWHERHGGGYGADCGDNLGVSWCNDWDFPAADKKNYSLCYEKKIKPQVEEILTNYGDLSLIWFDVPLSIGNEQCAELYRMVKKYQPDCLINSRLGFLGSNDYEYDYRSWGDNEIPEAHQNKGMLFETPATLNGTWGYKAYDQNFKSAEQVVALRRHLDARGVNYLLNVGPDYLGRFPAKSVGILWEAAKLYEGK